ncbi:hypothetical protein GVN24_30790 [Rhizobium sp. CRIBSB]|nr:hypothetical protein [Rhizobium sp. CRIBSB]
MTMDRFDRLEDYERRYARILATMDQTESPSVQMELNALAARIRREIDEEWTPDHLTPARSAPRLDARLLKTHALDVLSTRPQPATSRQVARMVGRRLGQDVADDVVLRRLDRAVRRMLDREAGGRVERIGSWPAQWRMRSVSVEA